MATLPAWEVPVRPTAAGKHRDDSCWSDYCQTCDWVARRIEVRRIRNDAKSHRAPTHAKPYSEDAEHAAAWRSELLPARTSHKQVAA